MATAPRQRAVREIDYPTGDGKPMAETDLHRNDMVDVIQLLNGHFAADSEVYVSGNLLMFYVEGNRRKHVAPDVFVVRGVKKKDRDHYLVWKEGKAPDLIIEITSKSTRREDSKKKWVLYRDVLKVPEYFQFDPTEDYLKPPLQGSRLVEGDYVPIEPVEGRLPSKVLGLHLERDGTKLRLFDPATGGWLPTAAERNAIAERATQAARQRAEAAEAARQAECRRAEAAEAAQEAERRRAEAAEAARQGLAEEIERLRRENDRLRGH